MSEPSAGMMVTTNVRLLRPLGEGGMGSVWVAEHQSLRTNVVVKFMAEQLAKSPEALARFSREAAAASQVKSPHVVQMLDHGVLESGAPYIVMELLDGRDLEQQLRESGRLDPTEVVAIVAQLARALVRAHERSIVHRDIKPSNVFLCDAGGGELFVKLLDFGIAKGQELGIVGSTTRTGSFIGSPYYMSPEQVIGAKDIDYRTDLWSLGVVAYEALTGEKPFHADTVGALALKIHRDPLPVPSKVNPALGPSIDEWFAQACAREPERRHSSAKDLAEGLAMAVTGRSIPPGLRVDSASNPRRPPGLETTLRGPEGVSSSGVDARSETGAGVGLLASQRLPVTSHGKWLVLAGIAVVAVGVGFAVPRMMGKSDPPPIDPRTTGVAPTPSPMLERAPPPPSSEPPAPSRAPAPVATPTSVPPSALAPPHSTGASPARPRASASSAVPPAPPPSATVPLPKPPPGSEDDIK